MIKKKIKFIYRLFRIDAVNILKYGNEAPRYAERIWISPRDVKMIFKPRTAFEELAHLRDEYEVSGLVINKQFPTKNNEKYYTTIENHKCIKECIEHFSCGLTWQDTGAYTRLLTRISNNDGFADGCRNLTDIKKRYDSIDKLFENIKKDKKLKTRRELHNFSFRERGTFTIHIDQNGELFLGKGGFHRFAIAWILDIPFVPAQIGCVSKEGMYKLESLRMSG